MLQRNVQLVVIGVYRTLDVRGKHGSIAAHRILSLLIVEVFSHFNYVITDFVFQFLQSHQKLERSWLSRLASDSWS